MRVPGFIKALDRLLSHQPAWVVMVLSTVLLALVGTMDYRLGPPIVLGPLFLVPIAISAWYTGRFFSVFVAFSAAVITDVLRDFTAVVLPNPRVLAWNGLMRLVVYLSFALLVRIVRLSVRMGAFPE
jgi:hypothetical protein